MEKEQYTQLVSLPVNSNEQEGEEVFNSHSGQDKKRHRALIYFCGSVGLFAVLCVGAIISRISVKKNSIGLVIREDCNVNYTHPVDYDLANADDICANPPVLMISLDGFRNSYFERNLNPIISKFGSEGVKAEYVRSAYPTKTFPNHYTIVTGLYPESHGIIDNYFYDKTLNDSFSVGNIDPKWWLGEPVWVTTVKQGLKSAALFWAGSEVPVDGILPTYYYPYDNSVTLEERVKRVLDWLDYPSSTRPQYIALYIHEPDESGHEAGPDSEMVNRALKRVDEVIGDLITGLKLRRIYNCVNIILVSDHGMTLADPNMRINNASSYLPNGIEASFPTDGTTLNINVEGDEGDVDAVLDALQKGIPDAPFRLFHLEDLPLRLHVGKHNKQRYGDLYGVGDLGSFIMGTPWTRTTLGEHGYDNHEEQMRSIFLARGPAFKKGYISPPHENIQTYNLACALLGVTPSENNGTFGALHHMLKREVAKNLPPVEETTGNVGVHEECRLRHKRPPCKTCFCSMKCHYKKAIKEIIPHQIKSKFRRHLPFGIPRGGEGDGACLLTNKHSVSLFSTSLNIPIWVAFQLTSKLNLGAVDGNTECYQVDPRHSKQCSDYTSSDYTLAHLAPLTDFALLTNAVPQLNALYQEVWSQWEEQLMNWTRVYGDLQVISGVLLDSDADGVRNNDSDYNHWLNGKDVAVPSGFYSIVTRCTKTQGKKKCKTDDMESIGLLLNNRKPVHNEVISDYLSFHVSTVADIEAATGINFFPDLLPTKQAALKLQLNSGLWEDQ